jgi:hypothetical protein
VIAAGIFLAAIHFDPAHNWKVVSRSADVAGRSWELHDYAILLARRDRPIVVLLPDPSYTWGGIEELIGLGFIDKHTGKWGGAIRERSPLQPVEFFSGHCVPSTTASPSGGPLPIDSVVIQPILLSAGQKPPDTAVYHHRRQYQLTAHDGGNEYQSDDEKARGEEEGCVADLGEHDWRIRQE